ncbi:MAG: hypothetical protein KF760_30685 [Candidatus Eremiobacteraeota bacterium]|nr:hypothetical protein [Candidatus Eremiobacteraeota bacterium]MCW5868615.1 hypothetical protein [Candidatus Eremiobacteraeota bacterium]
MSTAGLSRAELARFFRLFFFSVALALGFASLFLALGIWTRNATFVVGAEVGYWILAMGPTLHFWLPKLYRLLRSLPERVRHDRALARRYVRNVTASPAVRGYR